LSRFAPTCSPRLSHHCSAPVPRCLWQSKREAHPGFLVSRRPPPRKRCEWRAMRLTTCGDVEANPGPPRVPARSGTCSNTIAPPPRRPLGDGNGQVGAPRPAGGGPGWKTTEMVGNREWLARKAMHAVPPHPSSVRRVTGGGDPPAILSPLADTGGGALDTLGVEASRPPTPATPDPRHPGPPITHGTGFPCRVRGHRTQPGPGRDRPGRGATTGPACGHRAAGPGHPGALHPAA